MDDIGDRLSKVVDNYGPESLVVSTSAWNTSVDNGSGRTIHEFRSVRLIGSAALRFALVTRRRSIAWSMAGYRSPITPRQNA